MKTTTVTINQNKYDIDYDERPKEYPSGLKTTIFTPQNLHEDLKLGDSFEFDVSDSSNVIAVPALINQEADSNKSLVVKAILEAEGIDWRS